MTSEERDMLDMRLRKIEERFDRLEADKRPDAPPLSGGFWPPPPQSHGG
eukprot:CAMPEP_0114156754 /NCGR_PEP_ID=MMETSP0043_2-20121206/26231_1 /TAXON_ID=464988 /ORGANISM="Hemiselmis andersenii, Strain CCMP644" /LENGTH=48 /DNA_ID= /DNA_START= /DNA_END= /DNA_ORIENTATION=